MATTKSFTDLQQSKKLAKILPLESADMYWWSSGKRYYIEAMDDGDFNEEEGHVRAWSLAALLGVASTYCNRLEITLRADKKYNVFAVKNDFVFRSFDECSEGYDTPVDACYEMIIKLHELNLL